MVEMPVDPSDRGRSESVDPRGDYDSYDRERERERDREGPRETREERQERLAADGRGLQDVQINDNFATLSEALYVAEQKAREAASLRSKVLKEMMRKEKERKDQELRALAQKARSERTGAGASMPVASDRGRSESVDPRGDHDSYDRERERERDREGPEETREEREERSSM